METRLPTIELTQYPVGTLVLTTEEIGGNKPGRPGLVYASVIEDGTYFCSVILTNGHDIGVFSEAEANTSLDVIGTIELSYTYESPAKLMADYKAGLFFNALTLAEQKSIAQVP